MSEEKTTRRLLMRACLATPLMLFALTLALPSQAASIYRWVDAEGKIHYGDKPPVEATRLKDIEQESERYTVQTALDGDTLMLENGMRIRLIGVNAPEIAHQGQAAQAGGQEAMDYLYNLVKDQTVKLENEEQRFDRYHRRLAHPVLADGRSISRELLRKGLVHVSLVKPNIERAKQLLQDEAYARRKGLGIWAMPEFQIRDAADSASYRNTYSRLRGRVVLVQHKMKYTYLMFEQGLTVYLENEDLPAFVKAQRDPNDLTGRTLVVRGWVRQQSGQPVIKLNHPLEIESVN